jgi:hypothetical protein
MGKCYSIPKPSHSHHGKLRLKHICEGIIADEMEFDASKGDLFIEIICVKDLEAVVDGDLANKIARMEQDIAALKQLKLFIGTH